jgi:hypothetical protein
MRDATRLAPIAWILAGNDAIANRRVPNYSHIFV